ncbi:MAG: beta-ketoacyl-[acyl-carrier-protein] synthase family protein [Deltaproteobacteria bacterium]|nr:beta-ketoacyl-[acyl-carrier-protein] synthase family protein [Deltaproteobacteria bacterium]
MSDRIVITGIGIVTAAGVGVDQCWETFLSGRSAVARYDLFGPEGMASQMAAQVPQWPEAPDKVGPYDVVGRPMTFAVAAATEAMECAGIDESLDIAPGRRVVVAAGGFDDQMNLVLASAMDKSTAAGEASFEELHADQVAEHLLDDGVLAPMERYSQVEVMQALGHLFGAHQAMLVSTACAGGPTAIGDAVTLLRNGEADVALAMGVDTLITREMMGGFCNLTAMSTRNDDPARASRPFDADRDGFVMGEGAAALILELESVAKARGATVLAELAGVGYSSDAYGLTAPEPEGEGMALSMTRAVEDGGMELTDITYVNAHGTSTPANDIAETRAIRRAFGAHADDLVVSASKGAIGHLIHGAGAVGAVVAVQTIVSGQAHPTANLENPGPGCDLDFVVGEPRPVEVDGVLVNAFGFGGQNTTLAIRRYAAGAR